jgi:acyl-coenzyme A thioesterase PaaI-like protein
MNVKFRSSVNEGVIFAEANLVGKKKSFVFGEVQVKSDKGELLAEAASTFIVPNAKEGVEGIQNA